MQLNDHNNMDDIFRKKLENFRKTPPTDIWENISANIGKKEREMFIPLWRVAAGLALLITAGTLYYFISYGPNRNIAHQQDTFTPDVNTNAANETVADIDGNELQNNVNRQSNSVAVISENKKQSATESVEINSDVKASSQKGKSDDHSGEKTVYANVPAAGKNDALISEDKIQLSSAGLEITTLPLLYSPGAVVPDRIPAVSKIELTEEMIISLNTYDEKKASEKRHWSLTAQVSPTYTYRSLAYENKEVVNKFNETESGKLSYSGGFQLGYKATKRLSIYSGLMYAKAGTQINNIYSEYDQKNKISEDGKINPVMDNFNVFFLRNSTGVIETEKSNRQYFSASNKNLTTSTDINFWITSNESVLKPADKINQYFQFIEIPLLARYRIVDKKVRINLLGGLNTDVLIGNRLILVSEGNKSVIGETDQIRTLNYAGNFGFGFDYDLGKKLIFSLEPQFKYYLNSINNSQLISNRPYSLGMFTGVRYNF